MKQGCIVIVIVMMAGQQPTPSRTPKGYQPYLYNSYQPQLGNTDQRVERKAITDIRDLQEMNRRRAPEYGGRDDDSEEGMPLSPLPHQSQGDWVS